MFENVQITRQKAVAIAKKEFDGELPEHGSPFLLKTGAKLVKITTNTESCRFCFGVGIVDCYDPENSLIVARVCSNCNGEGEIPLKKPENAWYLYSYHYAAEDIKPYMSKAQWEWLRNKS